MRLAFAVSTCIEPEILLLDEAIGAGDAAFIKKARERLETFTDKAGIIVLASHAAQLMRRMCSKAVLLEHGRVSVAGRVEEVLDAYQKGLGSG